MYFAIFENLFYTEAGFLWRDMHLVLPLCKAELKGKAEAEVVVRVRRRVVVPIGYAAVPGVVVPAATTVHAVRALADTLLV